MNKELTDLVSAEAPKYVKEFFDKLKDGEEFLWDDVGIYVATKTAKFIYEHLSRECKEDEELSKWNFKTVPDPRKKGFCVYCTAKNAVIAARDAEIQSLEMTAAISKAKDHAILSAAKRISELEALVRDAEKFIARKYMSETDKPFLENEWLTRAEKVLK